MKKFGLIMGIFISVIMLALCANPVLAHTEDYRADMTSGFTLSPPTIDGEIATDEWVDANSTNFYVEIGGVQGYQYIYWMNTNDTLYMMFDMTFDDTNDVGIDNLAVAFDENNDGTFDNAFMPSETKHEAYVYSFEGGYSFVPTAKVNYYKLVWGFGATPNEDNDHEFVEMSMPLSDFNYDEQIVVGDTMGFHAEYYMGTGGFGINKGIGIDLPSAPTWIYPKESTWFISMDDGENDVEKWGDLTLGQYVSSMVTPPTIPTDHSQTIGTVFMAIGGILILALAIFRDEVGGAYWYLVAIFTAMIIFGAGNYYYGWVTSIPYILP